ncbi:hypothetical protein ACFO28_07735 [Flavobacterium buctense]|uniref:hypothetical protein n=1 Tax=Flavobacterium buctense TaxID=1648146 RepID=UPI00361A9A78
MNSKGNDGENFVNELAYNSFLKYWCYPSPKYENGDKKEICDLLILFNSVVILVSVKNYEFKGNHFRYFNNTIAKAVKQLHGAYRKLFSESVVIIKHPDKLAEIFPKNKIEKVFRIVINLGDGVKFYPFNQMTKNDDYVTLFDRDSFATIISELDTIPDFIDYLEKREKVFTGKMTIILPGEEFDFPIETQRDFFSLRNEIINSDFIFISGSEKDLLATFFKNTRNFPEVLNGDSNGYYLIIDGAWENYISIEKVVRKNEADKISYFIDNFVKHELLININPMRESLAKALLSFDRLTRRTISKSYVDFHGLYKNETGLFFGRRFGDFNGVGVLFTFYTNNMSFEMINHLNNLAIESSNLYTDYKSKSMILISSNNQHRFLFSYIDKLEKYTESLENEIRKDVETLGWFTKHTKFEGTEHEFPD